MRFKTAFCVKCNTERIRVKRRCQVCGEPLLMPSKHGNIPTRGLDGKMKQSRKEARRGDVLLALYRAGRITGLQPDPDDPKARQVEYRLELYATDAVDALIEKLEAMSIRADDDVARLIKNIRLSRTCVAKYRADFVYQMADTGELVVEDPKGYRTDTYRMKKTLMRLAHNIEIEEP